VNGNDSTGTGLATAPFATIAHAASVAVSGQTIYALPGTFTETAIVLAAGVWLKGCGIGVSIINLASSVTSGSFVTVNNAGLEELTLSSANSSNDIFPVVLASNAASITLREVDISGNIDVLYMSSGTSNVTLLAENSWFRSNWDASAHLGGPGNFSETYLNCHFIITYLHGASSEMRCYSMNQLSGFTASALFDHCEFQICSTDSAHPTLVGSSLNQFLTLGTIGSATCRNCKFFQNTPYKGSALSSPGWPTELLHGNEFVVTTAAGSSTIRLPSSPSTMTMSSSAVTPAIADVSEVSVDAGTLTSNLLTINAAPTAWSPPDQTQMSIRIANSNSGGTAMTLAFNSAYDLKNVSGSVPEIQAGYWANLALIYNANESAWALKSVSIVPNATQLYGGLMR
jgi:hypothetical protein